MRKIRQVEYRDNDAFEKMPFSSIDDYLEALSLLYENPEIMTERGVKHARRIIENSMNKRLKKIVKQYNVETKTWRIIKHVVKPIKTECKVVQWFKKLFHKKSKNKIIDTTIEVR